MDDFFLEITLKSKR